MNILHSVLSLTLLCTITSCSKEDEWLDKKYNLSDVTPTTISDFQKLLDNGDVMNRSLPALGLVGSDNYFLLSSDWQNAQVIPRNSYVWAKDIFEGSTSPEWKAGYQVVEYCNVVLDGLANLNILSNSMDYNIAKGSALFYRSMAFYNLAQIFCKRYSSLTRNEPGIPIRLTSDVNVKSTRDPVEKVYSQIFQDLKVARNLLPDFPITKTRASRVACDALLSRAYLNTGEYDSCIYYSTTALDKIDTLIDFSKFPATATFPFPTYRGDNPEVIFFAYSYSYLTIIANYTCYVDSLLYKSYETDDLRKSLFYKVISPVEKKVVFKGTYTGSSTLFGGLATNEIVLNRAEAYARTNHLNEAQEDINRLLRHRYNPNAYVDLSSNDITQVLKFILSERRKELPFTGQLRWEDLRRLNEEPRFEVELKRVVNGQTFTLLPKNERYIYPIPDDEVRLSGLAQNER